MPDLNLVVMLTEIPGELFADINRTVLTAGTTDRDGHIAAVAGAERR